MSSSMIYCQCNFCGTPERANTVASFVAPPVSGTTLTPLCTNGCKNVSAVTTTNAASKTSLVESEFQHLRQPEQLKFGIERILYGSSKSGKSVWPHLL